MVALLVLLDPFPLFLALLHATCVNQARFLLPNLHRAHCVLLDFMLPIVVVLIASHVKLVAFSMELEHNVVPSVKQAKFVRLVRNCHF